jgi:hypothetical protein
LAAAQELFQDKREKIMQRVLKTFVAILLLGAATFGTVFGTVRGIVHDPQHRPVPGSEVVLKAESSDYTQKTETDANGEFHFDAVPLGAYSITVTAASFAGQEQRLTVLSGTAPILHFELHIASQSQSESPYRRRQRRDKPSR